MCQIFTLKYYVFFQQFKRLKKIRISVLQIIVQGWVDGELNTVAPEVVVAVVVVVWGVLLLARLLQVS